MRCCWLLSVIAWGCLASGCSTTWVRADATQRSLRTVAVLPFLAGGEVGDDPVGRFHAKRLAQILAGRLAHGPYLLLAPAKVARRLHEAGLDDARATRAAPAATLRRVLGVDVVIQGELQEDLHVQAGLVYWRSVEARLEAIDLRSGGRLAVVDRLEVDMGGLLLEMGQPWEGVADSIESHDELSFVRLAEYLTSEFVRQLPAPRDPVRVQAPTIQSVTVHVERAGPDLHGPVGAGSLLRVSLSGDRGHQASLRLSGGQAIPIPETEPGLYRGGFRVAPGERCHEPRVLLTDAFGAASVRTLGVRIDARASLRSAQERLP